MLILMYYLLQISLLLCKEVDCLFISVSMQLMPLRALSAIPFAIATVLESSHHKMLCWEGCPSETQRAEVAKKVKQNESSQTISCAIILVRLPECDGSRKVHLREPPKSSKMFIKANIINEPKEVSSPKPRSRWQRLIGVGFRKYFLISLQSATIDPVLHNFHINKHTVIRPKHKQELYWKSNQKCSPTPIVLVWVYKARWDDHFLHKGKSSKPTYYYNNIKH